MPAVIGHEIVGQVEELGAEFAVEGADHRPGDAVADISADKLKRVPRRVKSVEFDVGGVPK